MSLFRIRNLKEDKWENGMDCKMNLFGDIYLLNEELPSQSSMNAENGNWIMNYNTGFKTLDEQFIFEQDIVSASPKDKSVPLIIGSIRQMYGMWGVFCDGDFYSLAVLEDFDVIGNLFENEV